MTEKNWKSEWEQLKKFSKSGKKICIYCRGAYGLRTYFKLRDFGVPIECFGDADQSVQGYVLNGIRCISYGEILQKDKENTILLVCKENPELLIEQFRSRGFLHTYSYEIVSALEEKHPQIKLDGETIQAINQFRERLYKIMHHIDHDNAALGAKDSFVGDLEQVLQDAEDRVKMRYDVDEYSGSQL